MLSGGDGGMNEAHLITKAKFNTTVPDMGPVSTRPQS